MAVMFRKLMKLVILPIAIVSALLTALLAWPLPLFAYSSLGGKVEFWSDRKIEHDAASKIGREITRRLAGTPFALGDDTYRLYVANSGWRWRILRNVIVSEAAGGFALYPVARQHAFLSGADFKKGLLRKSGRTVRPPRTLAYFGAHELVHVRTGQIVGAVRFHTMPTWIMEGIADYVAIRPRESFKKLHAALAGKPNNLTIWRRHGYYAQFRLRVQYMLEVEGLSLSDLLVLDLTFDEVSARMSAHVAGG